jgi:hypothetical protein
MVFGEYGEELGANYEIAENPSVLIIELEVGDPTKVNRYCTMSFHLTKYSAAGTIW